MMGSMSLVHWILVGIVVLVLFGGGGKITSLMGDFAKGIKSFKKHMAEEDNTTSPQVGTPNVPPAPLEAQAQQQSQSQAQTVHNSTEQPIKDAKMADEVKSSS